MATDAEVVRCASPWPGLAARVLEGVAALGPGPWVAERMRLVDPGIDPDQADTVLRCLEVAGVCRRGTEERSWTTPLSQTELHRLVSVLRGADHYRRLRSDSKSVELAVSLPMAPSHLENLFAGYSQRASNFLPTNEAFLRVARSSRRRLVVMSPFLNAKGFEWLKSLVEAADLHVEKKLILRKTDDYVRDIGIVHRDWLETPGVSVFDYFIWHEEKRLLPYETFHAKIVLADDTLAYVGSANVLGSGTDLSLEVGVLVEGEAAKRISFLVDGVLKIARRL
ncbi:phospholipase D-like domain-containing protein [Dongia soli]|uniref:Phospholipase D n=1 Tax=Dongia soli TaxID=600628 RepID=A0ABU5EGD6_9PROT|nr:phospholipase D-like domain-containing protein [Dongia soli]MDY0885392.1 phospholipase D-like domain-containing protein [Dongia soli]